MKITHKNIALHGKWIHTWKCCPKKTYPCALFPLIFTNPMFWGSVNVFLKPNLYPHPEECTLSQKRWFMHSSPYNLAGKNIFWERLLIAKAQSSIERNVPLARAWWRCRGCRGRGPSAAWRAARRPRGTSAPGCSGWWRARGGSRLQEGPRMIRAEKRRNLQFRLGSGVQSVHA